MNIKNVSYSDLSDSELFQLEYAAVQIQKNLMKYLVERFFSKIVWKKEWENKTRTGTIEKITSLEYDLLDIIREDEYTEIVIQDKVGYKFDIIVLRNKYS